MSKEITHGNMGIYENVNFSGEEKQEEPKLNNFSYKSEFKCIFCNKDDFIPTTKCSQNINVGAAGSCPLTKNIVISVNINFE